MFEENDVDFKIGFENSSDERAVCFNFFIFDKLYGFVLPNGAKSKIETLQSNGRKLHFARQSGAIGEKLVAATAASHGLTREDASSMLSKIQVGIRYSEMSKFPVRINVNIDRTMSLDVNRLTTVFDLKNMIGGRERALKRYFVTKGSSLRKMNPWTVWVFIKIQCWNLLERQCPSKLK